jgi:hypothetical protein
MEHEGVSEQEIGYRRAGAISIASEKLRCHDIEGSNLDDTHCGH